MSDGWILAEAEIEAALAAGQAELNQAIAAGELDAYLARAFANLSDITRADFAGWWQEHDVRVREGYPREPAETPCYAVVILQEDQTQYVGRQAPRGTLSDAAEGAPAIESWSSIFGVVVYAENAAMTRMLYQLGKYWLSRRQPTLQNTRFPLAFTLRGRDLGFAREFLPHFVYTRVIEVTAGYFQIDATAQPSTDVTDVIPAQEAGYASA